MRTATTVSAESRLRENNTLKADIAQWDSRHSDAVTREEALQKAVEDREAGFDDTLARFSDGPSVVQSLASEIAFARFATGV